MSTLIPDRVSSESRATSSPSNPPLRPGRRRLDLLVATSLAGAAAGSPLLGGLYDVRHWAPISLALCAGLIALLVAGRRCVGARGGIAVAGLAVFAAWSAVSSGWSSSPDRAWLETNRWGLYLGVVLVGMLALRGRREARRTCAVLAVVAGSVCVLVLGHLLVGDGARMFFDGRLVGPLGYANGFAGFAAMAMWLLVAWAQAPGPALMRGTAIALAVVAGGLLVLTQSRAGLPVLLVSTVVVLVGVRCRPPCLLALSTVSVGVALATPWLLDVYADRVPGAPVTGSGARVAGLAIVAGAIAAGALWGAGSRWPVRRLPAVSKAVRGAVACMVLTGGVVAAAHADDAVHRVRAEYRAFVDLRYESERSSRFATAGGNRHELWRVAIAQARRRPLTGVGAGGYSTVWFEQRRTADEAVRQPHSLPLQALSELGVPGLIALMTFVGGALWSGLRPGPGSVARDPTVRIAALGAFAVWFAHASVDWLHALPGVTGIALICAAALLAQEPVRTAPRRRLTAGRVMPVALGVLVVFALAASTTRYYLADRDQRAAARVLVSDPRRASALASRALDQNPASLDSRYLQAAARARLGDFEGARTSLHAAARTEPRNHVPWTLLGDLAVRRGRPELAARDYARALDRNPRDPALARAAQDVRAR